MVVSLVIIFLVSSVFVFIIGFACGQKNKLPNVDNHPPTNHPGPIYDNVLLSDLKHQEQDLELKENVAYGPSKSIQQSSP